MRAERPLWVYDEFQHIGVDFDDLQQVAHYTQRQGTTAATEQALIAKLGLHSEHSLVEIGCGTGVFACEAAKVCQQVYAVDVSQGMLKYAQDQAQQAGLNNITFHHAGFLSYQHPGQPVDFVVSKFALHHLPDFWKMAAFEHIGQLLKPGGIFYLRDVIFAFPPAKYAAHIEAWIARVAKPAAEGFTAEEFAMHVREEYSTLSWIIEGLLTRAGFAIQSSQQFSAEYAEYVAVKRP